MDHKEALNLILARACPHIVSEEGNTYYIDTHCQQMVVKARPLGESEGKFRYEIISVDVGKIL